MEVADGSLYAFGIFYGSSSFYLLVKVCFMGVKGMDCII